MQANKGIFVTSYDSFSPDAQRDADEGRIELVDGPTFVGWMREHGIPGFRDIEAAKKAGCTVADRHKRAKKGASAALPAAAGASSAAAAAAGASSSAAPASSTEG